jgi:hypothetical protein
LVDEDIYKHRANDENSSPNKGTFSANSAYSREQAIKPPKMADFTQCQLKERGGGKTEGVVRETECVHSCASALAHTHIHKHTQAEEKKMTRTFSSVTPAHRKSKSLRCVCVCVCVCVPYMLCVSSDYQGACYAKKKQNSLIITTCVSVCVPWCGS